MASLEDIKPNCSVRGILPSGVVTVVSVQWFGSDAIELTYKDATGRVGNELLYRDREADVEIVQEGRRGVLMEMARCSGWWPRPSAMRFYVLKRLGPLNDARLDDPRRQHIVVLDPNARAICFSKS